MHEGTVGLLGGECQPHTEGPAHTHFCVQLQLEDDQCVNLGLESSLTLRRLLVWTYDPKTRLKTLAALVDHCRGDARMGRDHLGWGWATWSGAGLDHLACPCSEMRF